MVEDWLVRAWTFRPAETYIDAWVQWIDQGTDVAAATDAATERRQRLEDFVWSLLNSREFLEND
jgi:hypothetical protein